MKVIYEAFDGKQFDDEWDCEIYEFHKTVLERTGVKVYDKRGHLLKNMNFNEEYDTYGAEHRVIVHNQKDLEDIKKVAKFTGLYCDIDSTGVWIYVEDSKNIFNSGWKKKREVV